MHSDRMLVIGSTGLLGQVVARQLRDDGWHVRALVRDAKRARRQLGPDVELVVGDIDDGAAIVRALEGCSGVHISLASARPEDADRVEYRGTARVAELAARQGLARLTYVSGMLVSAEWTDGIAQHQAKLRAEQAIRQSGVPYTIFKPTYFMDTLPRHVQGPLAIVLGRQPHPYHMTAACDFARMVARALRTSEAANREFFVQGPEAITIPDALRMYCRLVEPGKRVVALPLWLMRLIDTMLLRRKLHDTLQLMALMQRVGEQGDPAVANRVLGAATTTLPQWCEQQRRERSEQNRMSRLEAA